MKPSSVAVQRNGTLTSSGVSVSISVSRRENSHFMTSSFTSDTSAASPQGRHAALVGIQQRERARDTYSRAATAPVREQRGRKDHPATPAFRPRLDPASPT